MVRPVKLAAKERKDTKNLHNGRDAALRRSEPEWRRTAQRAVPTFRAGRTRIIFGHAPSFAISDDCTAGGGGLQSRADLGC
jgi:hypothetical protein